MGYVKCRSCDGLGKKFVQHTGPGPWFRTTTKEYPCRACDGTGINQRLYQKTCEYGYCSEVITYPRDATYPPKYCRTHKAKIAEEKAAKAAQWQTKPCPGLLCFNTIKYNVTWDRIPDLCDSCRAKKKQEREQRQANMREKPCPGYNGSCGNTIRWDVTKAPNGYELCRSCGEKKKTEREDKEKRLRANEPIYREKAIQKAKEAVREIVKESGARESGGETRYYQTHGDQRRQGLTQSTDADVADGVSVRVKSGWSVKEQKTVTDIYVYVKGVRGHYHFVVDDEGNELIDEWRDKD